MAGSYDRSEHVFSEMVSLERRASSSSIRCWATLQVWRVGDAENAGFVVVEDCGIDSPATYLTIIEFESSQ